MLTEDASGSPAGKDLVLTLAVRQNAPAFSGSPSPESTVDGITYRIEGSTMLEAFSAPVFVIPPLDPGKSAGSRSGYGYRSFALEGSNTLPNKGFLRARVSLNQGQ